MSTGKQSIVRGSGGTRPPIWVATMAAVLCIGLVSAARGDLVHLRSGAVLDIGWDYRVVGNKIHIVRSEGTIAIPMEDVQRIEKTERSEEEVRVQPVKPMAPPERAEARAEEGDSSRLREDMRRIIGDAMALVRDSDSADALSPEDQEEGLRRTASWTDQILSTQDEVRSSQPSDPTLQGSDDLLQVLRELRNELEQGKVAAPNLEESLRGIQDRMEQQGR